MKTSWIWAALLIAWSSTGFAQSVTGWLPSDINATLSVTSTSARVALPAAGATPPPPNANVCNTGSVAAYVAFGTSTVAATTGGSLVAAGVCKLLALPSSASYLAAITSSSSTTLEIEVGSGSPQSSLPGGGAGALTPIANGTVLGNSSGATAFPQALTTLPSGLTIPTALLSTPTITGLVSLNGYAPSFAVRYDSAAAAPTAAGTLYAVGDTITLDTTGGTCTTAPVMVVASVSGSGVAHYVVQNQGVCSVIPTQPQAQASSSGTGSGATFTLTYAPIAASFPTAPNGVDPWQSVIIGNGAAGSAVSQHELVAIGFAACNALTATATENTCVGWRALTAATSGSSNAAIGNGTLLSLTTGGNNTALGGGGALKFVTTGSSNTGVGANALKNAAGAATNNTAIGSGAMLNYNDTSASGNNTAIGVSAMTGVAGSTFTGNVAVGVNAGVALTTASNGVYVGFGAGQNLTTGSNTLIGYNAGIAINNSGGLGFGNTIVGATAVGSSNNLGNPISLVVIGAASGVAITNGHANTIVGAGSGTKISSGQRNVILGQSVSSTTLATGNDNVLIGTSSGIDTAAAGTGNTISIGTSSTAVWSATGAGTPSTSVTTIAGLQTVTGAQTLSSTLTYGGVTLTNAVTGTGKMVLDAAPAFATTITLTSPGTDSGLADSTVCRITSTGVVAIGSGTIGICLGTSSARYKVPESILPSKSVDPDMLLGTIARDYRYLPGYGDGGKKTQHWFVAEEVVKTFPECAPLDDGGAPSTVDPVCMTQKLWIVAQQQQRELDGIRRGMGWR